MRPDESARAPDVSGARKRSPAKDQASPEIVAQHRLIRTRQAVAYLGLSARTVWRLTNSGQVPHVRIGRSVRYDLRDLDLWIAKHRRGGGA
jgi:excisionase family DNA binding protein